ncbi:MAG: orotidine-5'-phosphate decarboxylase [Paludibacteraceae bacterium]|nr:orotidine-5'-phosphate decarboxylase [Paludibacteraceae bacterium]
MNRKELFQNIKRKKSFLCIGLDTDMNKIPSCLKEKSSNPIFEFNKAIIEATADLCVAYKPNLAFYESLGIEGWKALNETVNYLRQHYPDQFLIADAKRGDIGNTSAMYAQAFFEKMNFDSITVSPYMGEDSIKPFLAYPNKWTIILALTSNKGALDFQLLKEENTGERLFEKVLKTSTNWGTEENMMYVVGATKTEYLKSVRKLIPEHFLLIPGIGAQGGSLEETAKFGLNSQCGLLVNSSRQIIYASSDENFAKAARSEALQLQQAMENILLQSGIM